VRLVDARPDSDRADGSASFVEIDVLDGGSGVARRERERVFQPLYRADPRLAPGHGLGLALIGHIVRAHGGSAGFVDVSSGACLRVRLPGWSPARTEASSARKAPVSEVNLGS
jgi:signal transduction histidine kinase